MTCSISFVVAIALIPGTSNSDLEIYLKMIEKASPPSFNNDLFSSGYIKNIGQALPCFRIGINFHDDSSKTTINKGRTLIYESI